MLSGWGLGQIKESYYFDSSCKEVQVYHWDDSTDQKISKLLKSKPAYRAFLSRDIPELIYTTLKKQSEPALHTDHSLILSTLSRI